MKSATGELEILVEIRPGSFHMARANLVVHGDLERTPAGRLTEESGRKLVSALRPLLPPGVRPGSVVCHCAIPGTGVLLHEVRLPAASREETARLLRLRVESEFPLSPDELAWGYSSGPVSTDGSRNFRLGAVRKEILADYLPLFRSLELSPVISIAALARLELLPESVSVGALLDVGPKDAELLVIESGQPVSIRGLAGGATNDPGFDWSGTLRRQGLTGRRWVHGISVERINDSAAGASGNEVRWEPWVLDPSTGVTPAIAGLRRLSARDSQDILSLNGERPTITPGKSTGWPWPWMGLAAALLGGFFAAPYLEAIARGPALTRRVAAVKADSKNLGMIDREFGFLRHLEASQPPYVEALYLIANSAPPGTRLEFTSMNRRGEVALRGKAQNMAQVGDLRTKLMAAGFFSSVVVEDQSVGPNQPQVQFRLTAKWKSSEERESLTLGPELPATNPPAGASTNKAAGASTNTPPSPR